MCRLIPRRAWLIVLVLLLTPACLVACLWDTDTIQMERQRFPTTLELITGKFLRHSPEFYQWRIQDRLKKLDGDPDNAAWLDDLAVAYDKTGQHDKAIETMLRKAEKHADAYETQANLGTFYVHDGQFEKGLEHIERALAINPDAHFGREEYQKLLVEYVLTRRRDGKIKTPLRISGGDDKAGWDFSQPRDFATFVEQSRGADKLTEEERQRALEGVLGMMKFGNHRSPILLEALADLLGGPYSDPQFAKRLAARAYLKAAHESHSEDAKSAYRNLAQQALHMQVHSTGNHRDEVLLEEVERDLELEVTEAEQWYSQVRQNELDWIAAGKDPEIEFAKLYYNEPDVSTATNQPESNHKARSSLSTGWTVAGIIMLLICIPAAILYRRRRVT